jgi:hypothetical protein
VGCFSVQLPCSDGSMVKAHTAYPNVKQMERFRMLNDIKGDIAVLDVALENGMFALLRDGEGFGVHCCLFVDHHDDKSSHDVRQNIAWLRSRPGVEVRFKERKEAASCAGLVKRGELLTRGLRPVFHADKDGFLTALKGLGVTYPGLDDDADHLDGLRSKPLTFTGWLLREAIHTMCPEFAVDPEEHARSKKFVFEKMARWIAAGCPPDLIYDFATEVDHRSVAARRLAKELAAKAQLFAKRIIIVDTIAYRDLTPAYHEVKRLLIRKHGPAIICFVDRDRHGQERVTAHLPYAWEGYVDLRKFLPEAGGHCDYRLRFPLTKLRDFIEGWQRHRFLETA